MIKKIFKNILIKSYINGIFISTFQIFVGNSIIFLITSVKKIGNLKTPTVHDILIRLLIITSLQFDRFATHKKSTQVVRPLICVSRKWDSHTFPT
jgi:hypothetical protein